jgi:hypothetical protein
MIHALLEVGIVQRFCMVCCFLKLISLLFNSNVWKPTPSSVASFINRYHVPASLRLIYLNSMADSHSETSPLLGTDSILLNLIRNPGTNTTEARDDLPATAHFRRLIKILTRLILYSSPPAILILTAACFMTMIQPWAGG